MKEKTVIYDHLGNEYKNWKHLAESYKIPEKTFRWRMRNGWGLMEALTTPVDRSNNRKKNGVKDHMGNTYVNKTQMAEHYGLTIRQFLDREGKGWSLQKILTTPIGDGRRIEWFDHLGKHYNSFSEMCNAYGKNKSSVRESLKRGKPLEYALTHKTKKEVICVETGKRFETCTEAAAFANVSSSCMSGVLKKGRTAGGFHWQYA